MGVRTQTHGSRCQQMEDISRSRPQQLHLKLAAKGTHKACVWASVLVNFYPKELERKNKSRPSVPFRLECSVYVSVNASNSSGLSCSLCPAAHAFSVCQLVCKHAHLLGISAWAQRRLALKTQTGISLALNYLTRTQGIPKTQSSPHLAASSNWHG